MTARAAMVFRGVVWVLIAAVVATSAPIAGLVLGAGAIVLAWMGQSRGKSEVWTVPLLWAGVAAFLLATLFSWRAGLA